LGEFGAGARIHPAMVMRAAQRWVRLAVLRALASFALGALSLVALGALSLAMTGAAAAVEVSDDSGRILRLTQPARRIVALAPHLTELLFAAGAGGAIVGADTYSDYPPAAQSIPRIGDAHALDLERIIALEPDLIVAWTSGSPQRQLARLEALGLAVFRNEPRTLEAIASTIERLGSLAGTSAVAQARAADFRRSLARMRAAYADQSPVRVFYQVADQPLTTIGTQHVIADALQVCGAVSVFASSRRWLPRPSREAVLLTDPDAIVAAAVPGGTEALAGWRRWTLLRAVRSGRLFTVDPNVLHRATPRILEGIARLCGQLRAARPGGAAQ
jgi:iron complex transport system substrate-binding protein